MRAGSADPNVGAVVRRWEAELVERSPLTRAADRIHLRVRCLRAGCCLVRFQTKGRSSPSRPRPCAGVPHPRHAPAPSAIGPAVFPVFPLVESYGTCTLRLACCLLDCPGYGKRLLPWREPAPTTMLPCQCLPLQTRRPTTSLASRRSPLVGARMGKPPARSPAKIPRRRVHRLRHRPIPSPRPDLNFRRRRRS